MKIGRSQFFLPTWIASPAGSLWGFHIIEIWILSFLINC
uniref:Uncharacterized protein n=1 Tax=Arundo donax TaxID=35708 RepID=A0A0A9HSM6_ARUDO